VESMEVETYHFTRCPKYDMDAYMATLSGGEICVEQKANRTLNTSSMNIFA
jgi:hypothetical protein